jgi:hypothetical protein
MTTTTTNDLLTPFGRELFSRLQTSFFGVLSAELSGPQFDDLDADEVHADSLDLHNIIATGLLADQLVTRYGSGSVHPSRGMWEGSEETSFLVFGALPEEITTLGYRFHQAAVATNMGMFLLTDDGTPVRVNPNWMVRLARPSDEGWTETKALDGSTVRWVLS